MVQEGARDTETRPQEIQPEPQNPTAFVFGCQHLDGPSWGATHFGFQGSDVNGEDVGRMTLDGLLSR